jgi:hypothetical protein
MCSEGCFRKARCEMTLIKKIKVTQLRNYLGAFENALYSEYERYMTNMTYCLSIGA